MLKKTVFLVFILLLFSRFSVAALPLQADGQALPSLAPMLEHATPAVVNIATRSIVKNHANQLLNDPLLRRFFELPRPRPRESKSLGSGVIVDAKRGYILTNNHVIDGADSISVTLRDGRELQAKMIGADPKVDLAVIQIPSDNLVALPWSQNTPLRVGDFVVAVGNPFGLGQTVTSGIISALGRSSLGIEDYEDFIQTDASINPGNSGGALVNLRGELIGINTAILGPNGSNIGIGFAIPASMAQQIMTQLIEFGEVRRGHLGISVQNLTPRLRQAFGLASHHGVVITQVDESSPAQRAGLHAGDVILALDGKKVRGTARLRNAIGLLRVGQKVTLEIVRNGQKRSLSATIAQNEQRTMEGGRISPYLQGAQLSNKGEKQGERTQAGVLISKLKENSPAAQNGLRVGDLIVSANRQNVHTISALKKAVSRAKNLLINLHRGKQALFLLIQ
ncbi:MAG: DegQ family serine endoprotease [Gammaproteobacteria bacterium]|nr:DegQ family serine endoprotease [Gammaproteobacteria bacterium]